MIEWLPLLALGGAVFAGTATQRVSGMGFALVAAPFLVALLGPLEGVLVVNILAVVTAGAVLASVWRRVQVRRALLLLIPAAIATIPGAIVARVMPSAVLSTMVGALVVLALVASLLIRRGAALSGRGGVVMAGAVSGFMSVTAGVGGPAISAYAIATRWPQLAFAATAQLYFCLLGIVSVAAKFAWPQLSPPEWAVCGIAVVAGIAAGHALARVVSPRAARVLVVVLAFSGAAIIIAKGVGELTVH